MITRLATLLRRRSGRGPADACWTWFSDPRAVRHVGRYDRTYVGFVTRRGAIRVAAYDHSTRAWQEHTLHERLQVDDHASPALLVRPDGRLVVFYSAHCGPEILYRISTRPEEVAGWSEEHRVGCDSRSTYTAPVMLAGDGRLWLHWRSEASSLADGWDLALSTSSDGGLTWAGRQRLFHVPGQRPYFKIASAGIGRIDYAVTDGHPAECAESGICHFYYADGQYHRSDGTVIDSPLPLDRAAITRVYEGAAARAWIWDICPAGDGSPVIVFAVFPPGEEHRYRYARWTGSSWAHHEITGAGHSVADEREPYYSGGACLDPADPRVVYLSRLAEGRWRLERWSTRDAGRAWSATPIAGPSRRPHLRPVAPRGAAPDLRLTWLHGGYRHYTVYRTGLLTSPGTGEPV